MANKKGAELSLNFIIIAAIVLVVLIVAILFFTGASGKLLKQKAEVTKLSTQEYNLALTICRSSCSAKAEAAYDNPSFTEGLVKAGYTSCEDLVELEPFADECSKSCKEPAGTPEAPVPAEGCTGKNRADCKAPCKWEL
ncbi:MAG TPA: hypothetical protein HA362_02205 [Nanoarchaeota archaeon]|nr:hypothetical protein [Nanoarchaeota archaeon]